MNSLIDYFRQYPQLLAIFILFACCGVLALIFLIIAAIKEYRGIYRVDDGDSDFGYESWSGYYLTTDQRGRAKQLGKEVKVEKGDYLFKAYLTNSASRDINSLASIRTTLDKDLSMFRVSIDIIFKLNISEEFDPQKVYELLVIPRISLETYLYRFLDEKIKEMSDQFDPNDLLQKFLEKDMNYINLKYQIGKMFQAPMFDFKNIHSAGITIGEVRLTI